VRNQSTESIGEGSDDTSDNSSAHSADERAESGAGEAQGDTADECSAGSTCTRAFTCTGNNISAVYQFHVFHTQFHHVRIHFIFPPALSASFFFRRAWFSADINMYAQQEQGGSNRLLFFLNLRRGRFEAAGSMSSGAELDIAEQLRARRENETRAADAARVRTI
jgi:hypothetical protein